MGVHEDSSPEPESAVHSDRDWFADRLSQGEQNRGDWAYPRPLPTQIQGETVHRFLPFWVVRKGVASKAPKLHAPVEGAEKTDPDPLCGTALHDESHWWEGADILVYPPPEFHPFCTRCESHLERLSR